MTGVSVEGGEVRGGQGTLGVQSIGSKYSSSVFRAPALREGASDILFPGPDLEASCGIFANLEKLGHSLSPMSPTLMLLPDQVETVPGSSLSHGT